MIKAAQSLTGKIGMVLPFLVFAAVLLAIPADKALARNDDRQDAVGKGDRARPPPVHVTCDDGICPSVVLCGPWSVWDAQARECRQVSFCPGDRQVQIPGGPCELHCGPGMEVNPFDPNHCRRVFSCPQGKTEKADGVCAILCPDGKQENPFAPGTCRPAFSCPDGREEVADGACAPLCGDGLERDPLNPDRCSPIAPLNFCVSDAAGDDCGELARTHGADAVNLSFAHTLALANGEVALGQGVTVGVVEAGPLRWRDSDGVIRTHSDLPRVKKSFCRGQPEENRGEGLCHDDEADIGDAVADAFHGVAVLGVLAAKKDGRGLAGIAPESDYLYAWLNYHPILAYQDMAAGGAAIINNSWTPEYHLSAHNFRAPPNCGPVEVCLDKTRANLRYYARETGNLGGHQLETDDGRFIDLEADQLLTEYDYIASETGGVSNPADRPIYVWSGGNNNGRMVTADITIREAVGPSDLPGPVLTVLREGSVVTATALAVIAGLPYYFPDMTLNNLAVAAVDEVYEAPVKTVENGVTLSQSPIASFSNRCGGGASSFCLAAPGVASWDYSSEEYVEIGEEIGCVVIQNSNGRSQCVNINHHEQVLTRLAAEKFRTGLGAGFLLAPETEAFARVARLLPTVGYEEAAGTSFAAPMVSGALALMKSYFMLGTDCGAGERCGLGSHELTRRILATADRRGIYADASIYGSGLLDLKNALTPQGELRLLRGRSVRDSDSHLLSQSALRPGSALGDSALRALGGVRLAAFDEMNAPFPVFGDAVLLRADSAGAGGAEGTQETRGVGGVLRAHQLGLRGGRASRRLDWDFGNGYGFLALQGGDFLSSRGADEGAGGLTDIGMSGFGNPYSALAGDGMVAGVGGDGFRLAAFGEGLGEARRVRGALAEFSPLPSSSLPAGVGLSFQVGGVEELDGLLDTSGAGIFGDLRARTAFAGVRFSGEFMGDWRIRAGGFAGRTAAEDGGGWFAPVEDLWSGSYALGLERDDVLFSGDGLGFRVHQPLRASEGFRLRVPTGRTRYGELTWREVSGESSGRELALEGLYRRPVEGGSWLLSAGIISDAGHRSDARTLARALFAFEREF